MKNRFVTLLFAFALVCGAAAAATPAEQQAQAMAALAQQPPLSQADLDAFVKMVPEISKVMNDPNAIMKLYQDNGVSPERFALVSSKITIGFMMNQGMTKDQILATGQVPEVMIPNDAELALIKKSQDALGKALGMPAK